MGSVIAAAIAFVGTHFLLSHPLRKPLVDRIGAGGFLIVYSVVAFAALMWLGLAYRAAPAEAPLWGVNDAIWIVATLVMLIASILLVGSLLGNPAFPDPTATTRPVPDARGVFAVTRHPMMWSFALWGLCHIAVFPVSANIVVSVAIVVLALVGATLQDRKKEELQPHFWPLWEKRTSYWPFAAIATGRAKLRGFRPHDWAGGLVLWLTATWAHIPLAGWAAGIWRWIN